jgi:DMSO reductase anchor subunit
VSDQADLEMRGIRYQAIFPMPVTSRTEPRVYVKPHPAAARAGQTPEVLNQEEFASQRKHSNSWAAWEEIPLLAFTLSAQMAAGISWVLGILVLLGIPFSPLVYLAIGAILGLGLIVSFLHLGSPKNAWRVFGNLRKSWLSREILASLLFMLCWAICSIFFWLPPSLSIGRSLLTGITGLAGAALVFSMSEVYRLRMVPAWNTWRTKAAFFLSATILGGFIVDIGLTLTGMPIVEKTLLLRWLGVGGILFLGMELSLTYSEKGRIDSAAKRIRDLLTLAGIAGAVLLIFLPVPFRAWIGFVVFLLIFLEEIIGRWIFYSSRNPIM